MSKSRKAKKKLPKAVAYDNPIILRPDVSRRVTKRIDVWKEVWQTGQHSRIKLALLLTGQVEGEGDEAYMVVNDFFTLPGWSWSSIEVEATLTAVKKIAKEHTVVATAVIYAESEGISPIDVGLMMSVDAVVKRPIPHILMSTAGGRTIISFKKCKGITELLKSLRANLKGHEGNA